MDKKKIVHAAREAVKKDKERESNAQGEPSFIDDVIGSFFEAISGSSDDSSNSQSDSRAGGEGKLSGRKPQSQAKPGGIAGVGRNVADQLRRKK